MSHVTFRAWFKKLLVTVAGAVLPTITSVIAAGATHPELFHTWGGWLVILSPAATAASVAYLAYIAKSPLTEILDEEPTERPEVRP